MEKLIELESVEETKHLVPNLPTLVKAVFGDSTYLLLKAPRQADWATDKIKVGDGLLFLPWLRQLWLIELEWKEESNFFEQSRAFAEGRINEKKLFRDLQEALSDFEQVVQSASDMREGKFTGNIIKQTFINHVFDGYLRPHGWVILGHSGNREKLRKSYEKELKRCFSEEKHWILSMARMFSGDFSSYILLEQYRSEGCKEILSVESSILVPALVGQKAMVTPGNDEEKPRVRTFKGRAGQVWACLRTLNPSLPPENVRLRIRIDKNNSYDFKIDWSHYGNELMVFGKQNIHQKPAKAAKQVFGSLPEVSGNIARQFGEVVDVSQSPPARIALYKDVEDHIWQLKGNGVDVFRVGPERFEDNTAITYFDSISVGKQKLIYKNIRDRSELWQVFIEKRIMMSSEFGEHSNFEPHTTAGFFTYLTKNRLANRFGNILILNEAVIPKIQKLLNARE